MNKRLSGLVAMLAIAPLAGCGAPEATSETPAGVASDQPATGVGEGISRAPASQASGAAVDASEQAAVTAPPAAGVSEASGSGVEQAALDGRNAAFSLDGKRVALKDGRAQVAAAPGSASMVTTRYLGKAARGDLTSDGKEDVAYFVTRDGGGSGLFYYVVAAVQQANGYKTTNAFLVGDRIDPQGLRITSNELHVNFKTRGRDEPMTAPPTRDSVLLLKVTPGGVLQGLMK